MTSLLWLIPPDMRVRSQSALGAAENGRMHRYLCKQSKLEHGISPPSSEASRLLSYSAVGFSCYMFNKVTHCVFIPCWLHYTHDAYGHCFLLLWFHEHAPPWFFVSLANQFGRSSVAMADSPTLRYAALGANKTKPDVLDAIPESHPVENVFIML